MLIGEPNMKINPLNQTEPVIRTVAAGLKSSGDQKNFNEIFEQKVGETYDAPTTPHGHIFSLRGPSMQLPITPDDMAMGSINCALNHLEHYQQMLGDHRSSLRSMESTVNRMKQDAANLESVLNTLPEDEAAKPIMQETLMLVVKEIARFEQGNYVDSN
jgi:hypothetical protein